MYIVSHRPWSLVLALAFTLVTTASLAQRKPRTTMNLEVQSEDRAAGVASAPTARLHLMLTDNAAQLGVPRDWPRQYFLGPPTALRQVLPARGEASAAVVPSPLGPSFYPADVVRRSATGVTIVSAQAHNLYVNCSPPGETCWGDPETFLDDFGQSDFIHLLDQYVGVTAPNRYSLANTVFTVNNLAISPGANGVPTLLKADILALVHRLATQVGGSGYGHIYHVFLPKGVDTCSDDKATQCYSPETPATFVFCGYHSVANFPDLGNVYFTVEAFQNVSGCAVPATPPSPNGQLADSTNSTLSHEVFEIITDPDLNTGFRTAFPQLVNDQEIGDLCHDISVPLTLNGFAYQVQLEYSNTFHACAAEP